MGDDFKQKVCLSQRGKRLQGREEMPNINMDHRSQDVVTDATAVSAGSKKEGGAMSRTKTREYKVEGRAHKGNAPPFFV